MILARGDAIVPPGLHTFRLRPRRGTEATAGDRRRSLHGLHWNRCRYGCSSRDRMVHRALGECERSRLLTRLPMTKARS
jgi:hypothetical protein